MLSSAFSLGEPVNTTKTQSVADSEAEAEFEKVVDGMKGTSLEEDDPLSWRPSRPHNSGFEDRPQHRLSSSTVESKPSSLADAANSELPLSRCLFCNYNSPTWQLSVAHMTKIHGLFIPEQSYLVNPEGMLRYFQRKITQNHECICCHKIKTTATGAQAHMRDKGHCKVAFETEEEMLEVGQFYDFSSTYSDDEDEDASSEDTEMGEASKNADRWVKLDGGDDGWETDSSASSLDSAELSAVPLDDHSHQYSKLSKHRHHAHDDPRSHRNRDGFHSHAHSTPRAVFYDDYELHLPSGRTAGHRSQARIFRQNLHNYPTPQERLNGSQRAIEAGRADEEGDAVMNETESARPERGNSHSGALIGRSEAGMLGVTDAQKREVRAAEKRDRRIGHQARNRYQARLEKQNNNQKHYRVSCSMDTMLICLLTFFRTLCCSKLWRDFGKCH